MEENQDEKVRNIPNETFIPFSIGINSGGAILLKFIVTFAEGQCSVKVLRLRVRKVLKSHVYPFSL